MNPIRLAGLLAALVVLVGILAACTPTDPRLEDESAPPTAAPTAASTPSASAESSDTHVTLEVATADTVTVDVTDASSSLMRVRSGTPGDGASVEALTVAVTNLSPKTLRLTWVGGPCDSANRLLIDPLRRRLVVIQPECPGDAIATDRVLDLEFATPIKASDIQALIQDGLDS